mmetsp:Transcript_109576/g.251275  ORF Transcript_109576/g.251275 Transcript_109576/m.251275 type:complete len:242 (+) Transcript_109576:879-1604(+)
MGLPRNHTSDPWAWYSLMLQIHDLSKRCLGGRRRRYVLRTVEFCQRLGCCEVRRMLAAQHHPLSFSLLAVVYQVCDWCLSNIIQCTLRGYMQEQLDVCDIRFIQTVCSTLIRPGGKPDEAHRSVGLSGEIQLFTECLVVIEQVQKLPWGHLNAHPTFQPISALINKCNTAQPVTGIAEITVRCAQSSKHTCLACRAAHSCQIMSQIKWIFHIPLVSTRHHGHCCLVYITFFPSLFPSDAHC